MAAPRTKRQFAGAASDPAQRQITSFFNPSAGASSPLSYAHSTEGARFSSPATFLPASVQSNLISVGMRVRKSVPEGYKTGSYSAFSLWDDANATAGANAAVSAKSFDSALPSSPERNRSRANAFSTPRELMPFCGIHRVGGLDVQSGWEGSSGSSANDSPLDDFDDLPGLMSSQGSAVSTTSYEDLAESHNNARKRIFVDDGEDAEGIMSTRSLAPTGWDNGRVIAVPKKMRARGKAPTDSAGLFGASSSPFTAGRRSLKQDQENVMIVNSDFEEAEFLDQQNGWEVAMSDA